MIKKAFFAAATVFSYSASAATSWNMATPYPDADFHTQNIKQFIADVKDGTNGQVDITLHSGASLYKAPEIFKAVRGNQVEIGELILSSLGNDDPLFQLDTLPFLATNYDQAQKLWQASQDEVKKVLNEKGVVLLYTVPWPGQGLYTNEPVENIDYFKGKKLRAYNAMTADIAAHLGAAPVTVEASDIPQAFSTGQINAMITSSATGVSSQVWDFLNTYTKANAWFPKNMVFVSQKAWRRLSDDERAAILAAAEKAEKRGWVLSQEKTAENEKILADHGIAVVDASPELQTAFGKVGDEMAANWLKATGDSGQKILSDYKK